MNTLQLRLVGAGAFYLFVFLSGLGLSRSGMPYGTAVLTIHKLIALAALVFVVVIAYRRHQAAPLSAVELTAVAIAVSLFVGTIVTGGLLSTGKVMPVAVLRLHQITPFLTVLATAVALYFLLAKAESSVVLLK